MHLHQGPSSHTVDRRSIYTAEECHHPRDTQHHRCHPDPRRSSIDPRISPPSHQVPHEARLANNPSDRKRLPRSSDPRRTHMEPRQMPVCNQDTPWLGDSRKTSKHHTPIKKKPTDPIPQPKECCATTTDYRSRRPQKPHAEAEEANPTHQSKKQPTTPSPED